MNITKKKARNKTDILSQFNKFKNFFSIGHLLKLIRYLL